ncbi:MAG: hypothetical protein QOG48_220 [Verrucomicrobiota bacterium]|jgi:hypothetical protein
MSRQLVCSIILALISSASAQGAPVTRKVLSTASGHPFVLIESTAEAAPARMSPFALGLDNRREAVFAAPAVAARTAVHHIRDEAKTSIVSGARMNYAGLTSLLSLFNRANMRAPNISDRDDNRVAIEKKNVSVTAYLYAIKHQDDDDYHIILGSSALPRSTTKFLNVEISRLPDDGASHARLSRVRTKFENWLAGSRSTAAATRSHQKIAITGSIFFDTHHPAGEIGAAEFHPQTAWEIHPVSDINFSP